MGAIASQITSLTTVYSAVYSDADQRNHQSPASLAFVENAPGTGDFPTQRASHAEMFPFDDVIMYEWIISVQYMNYHEVPKKQINMVMI